MKFSNDTKSIGGFADHKTFRRDLAMACKKVGEVGKLTDYADNIPQGIAGVITAKMWETAREQRNNARYNKRRIVSARDNIRHVLELVAAATGGTVSVIKHALETRHEPMIMRMFEIKGSAILDEVQQLKDAGITVSHRNSKWYQHKPVKLDFYVLRATLHEQCNSFYQTRKGERL